MTDFPSRRDQTDSATPRASDEQASGRLTRRNVLAGAAATTAAVTISAADTPVAALSVSPNVHDDMILFVLLSAALTGIPEARLAPGFRTTGAVDLNKLKPSDFPQINVGSDPVDIKREYFIWVNDRHFALFESLLRLTRDNLNPDGRTRAVAIIEKVQVAADDIKFLARSIVLMWYLGAWYKPDALKTASTKAAPGFVPFEVISPKAYTQSWVLRVAQAHPMGFSELQFGYWSRDPAKIDFLT